MGLSCAAGTPEPSLLTPKSHSGKVERKGEQRGGPGGRRAEAEQLGHGGNPNLLPSGGFSLNQEICDFFFFFFLSPHFLGSEIFTDLSK